MSLEGPSFHETPFEGRLLVAGVVSFTTTRRSTTKGIFHGGERCQRSFRQRFNRVHSKCDC